MANSYTSKKNKQFLYNATLLLVASVFAVGVATFLTNPNNNLNTQSKAAYKLEGVGTPSLECDSFPCWAKLMNIQRKYLTKSYPWMKWVSPKVNNAQGVVTEDLPTAFIFSTLVTNLKECLNKNGGNRMGDRFGYSAANGETIKVGLSDLNTLDNCMESIRPAI